MADKTVVANLEAQLTFDASKFKKGMAESEKDLSTFRNKLKSISNGIVAGIGVAVTAATGSLVAFGKSSIDAGKEFDSAISQYGYVA